MDVFTLGFFVYSVLGLAIAVFGPWGVEEE